MKKILSLLLCLCMLLSTVAVFSSCKKEYTGEPEVSKKVIDVDLSNYNLVYPSTISKDSQEQVRGFAQAFKSVIGGSLRVSKDNGASTGNEILVGAVDREETKKTLESIDGHGFAICVFDGAIVIVGTTYLFTKMAMEYFVEKFLQGKDGNGSVLSINKTIVLENAPVVTLAADGAFQTRVVYADGVDTDTSSLYGKGDGKDTVDLPFAVYQKIATSLAGAMSIGKSGLTHAYDTEEAVANEILIGLVNREESSEVISGMDANQYGVVVRNGKVVIAASNDTALAEAMPLFVAAISDSVVEDKDGNKSVVMPADYSEIRSLDVEWITEFPKFEAEGAALIQASDVGDGAVTYAYRGLGVSAAAFDEYCEMLKSKGYAAVMTNEIEGSKFTTLENSIEKIYIHVEYAAYKHASEQSYSYKLASEYGATYEPTIRVTVYSSTTGAPLPKSLYKETMFNKICDPMITSLKMDYTFGDNWGMSYIITLEDGSFIVFDGGSDSTGNGNAQEASRMWNVLCDLHAKTHNGNPPNQQEKLHVRAWIMTHEHRDHYGTMNNFANMVNSSKEKKDVVQFDYLMGNFTANSEDYNSHNPAHVVRDNVETLRTKLGFKYVKLHTGQKFYLANAEIEVLFTHEDFIPLRMYSFNDSSTVLRINLDTTDKNTGLALNTQSTIWTGDAFVLSSSTMRAMYGENLKADMVQLSHHGADGCEAEFYRLVNPTVIWWPYSAAAYVSMTNGTGTSFGRTVDYVVAHEIDSIRYIILEDNFNTTVTLKADGPDFNDLYDAYDHNVIAVDGSSIIYKAPKE